MGSSTISVLTVLAGGADATPLAVALSKQILPQTVKLEWCLLDLSWPNHFERVKELHEKYLSKWKIIYAPVVRSLLELPIAQVGALRNQAVLLAGNYSPNPVMCVPLGIAQLPAQIDYIWKMHGAMKIGLILIPRANGNPIPDAAPFPLIDYLELNGMDELWDGGAVDAPSNDLIKRLSIWFEVADGPGLTIPDHHQHPPVIRCDRTIASAERFTKWDANGGSYPPNVLNALRRCPELVNETCTFAGRRCDVLELARFGHPMIELFISSRPQFDLMAEWMSWKETRKRLTIAMPEELELSL